MKKNCPIKIEANKILLARQIFTNCRASYDLLCSLFKKSIDLAIDNDRSSLLKHQIVILIIELLLNSIYLLTNIDSRGFSLKS